MSFDKTQLRELVSDTLKEVNLWSTEAEELILGTIAQESAFGKYIKQIKGPARGIIQMERPTFNYLIDRYEYRNKYILNRIKNTCDISSFDFKKLEWNLKLNICMCRLHYLNVPEILPKSLTGMALYWKKYYNTYAGKGTTNEFMINYKKHVI